MMNLMVIIFLQSQSSKQEEKWLITGIGVITLSMIETNLSGQLLSRLILLSSLLPRLQRKQVISLAVALMAKAVDFEIWSCLAKSKYLQQDFVLISCARCLANASVTRNVLQIVVVRLML
jgi:hypothetical protein